MGNNDDGELGPHIRGLADILVGIVLRGHKRPFPLAT